MKKRVYVAVVLVLAVSLLFPASSFALSHANGQPASREKTPGVELAQTISLITGVAISPLMGVGAVGAWKFYAAKTAQELAEGLDESFT